MRLDSTLTLLKLQLFHRSIISTSRNNKMHEQVLFLKLSLASSGAVLEVAGTDSDQHGGNT